MLMSDDVAIMSLSNIAYVSFSRKRSFQRITKS